MIYDERTWADGQDFYDPEHSPHIYADQDKANSVYDELETDMDDWEPLKEIIYEGSGERLASYHLIAVDENENERIVAERDLFELYAMMAETREKLTGSEDSSTEHAMPRLYRIAVSTLWPNAEAGFAKRREMVYDFFENDLIPDEHSWPDGENFHAPETSPHIYANRATAESVYANSARLLEHWGPLAFMNDSDERIESIQLISVDENGDEDIEAEIDHFNDLVAVNAAYGYPTI